MEGTPFGGTRTKLNRAILDLFNGGPAANLFQEISLRTHFDRETLPCESLDFSQALRLLLLISFANLANSDGVSVSPRLARSISAF